MSHEEGRLPRSLPVVVCRFLRTKNAFGTRETGAVDWREGHSTTAVYWCLRTMETWGTDERVAHAHDCRAGRSCFEAPFGADDVA